MSQKGGTFTKAGMTPNQAVLSMMINPKSEISIISDASLKGFIFKISLLDPTLEDFVFYTFQGTRITKPVDSIIIKLAIVDTYEVPIDDYTSDDLGDSYNFIKHKYTDSIDDYFNEAKIQQKIYRYSIVPNAIAIDLSVITLMFLARTEAISFLNIMNNMTKPSRGKQVTSIKKYIISQITSRRKLGIIAMEIAQNNSREPYKTYRKIPKPDKPVIAPIIIAQLIRLFCQLKIINTDLHDANVLCNTAEKKAFLIDFGRFVDFGNKSVNVSDQILTAYALVTGSSFSHDITPYLNSDNSGLNLFSMRDSDVKKQNAILTIIKIIACMDFAVANTKYNDKRPQCYYILLYLKYGISTEGEFNLIGD